MATSQTPLMLVQVSHKGPFLVLFYSPRTRYINNIISDALNCNVHFLQMTLFYMPPAPLLFWPLQIYNLLLIHFSTLSSNISLFHILAKLSVCCPLDQLRDSSLLPISKPFKVEKLILCITVHCASSLVIHFSVTIAPYMRRWDVTL